MTCVIDVTVFAANKALEKKVSEGEELKIRLEAELREKIKKMEKELENATVKAAGKHCCKNTHSGYFISKIPNCLHRPRHLYLHVCPAPGVPSLTEEQLGSMCPSAAAIAAIVKPGMKFFDVSLMGQTRAGWHGLTQVFKLIFTCDELYSTVL